MFTIRNMMENQVIRILCSYSWLQPWLQTQTSMYLFCYRLCKQEVSLGCKQYCISWFESVMVHVCVITQVYDLFRGYRALGKKEGFMIIWDNCLFFFSKYVVGTHQNRLGQAILKSTSNIHFVGEIKTSHIQEL